jgi:hypothetical protein
MTHPQRQAASDETKNGGDPKVALKIRTRKSGVTYLHT